MNIKGKSMSHLDKYYKDLRDLDMIIPLNGSHKGRRRVKIHYLQTIFQEEQKAKKRLCYAKGQKVVSLLKGKQLI